MKIKSLCVFCGSRPGNQPAYQEVAHRLGEEIARRQIKLVYGGGNRGIMGTVANAVLENNGYVIGIIPEGLTRKEQKHLSLQETQIVGTMHERKASMADRSDAFIALPGGFGTLEELFEIITWAQLGIHHKPIAILNTDGYFDPILEITRRGIDEGFIELVDDNLFHVSREIDEIFTFFEQYIPKPNRPRWITREEI